jgi:hypothetical protein
LIGYDRPLRPEWIHQTLNLWRPNTPIREFFEDFNKIAYQLYGREGKRKVRTVLFRYFFDFKGRPPNQVTIENSPLVTLSKRLQLDELKPLYLTVLILRSTTVHNILKTILRLYPNGTIKTQQLVGKSVGLYGERDVVKRSTRSFLTTLVYFGILNHKGMNYIWKNKLLCSTEQLAYVIAFFCMETGCFDLSLEDIRQDSRFGLLDLKNLEDCAKKYNAKLWSYIRRPSTSKISLSHDFSERITEI